MSGVLPPDLELYARTTGTKYACIGQCSCCSCSSSRRYPHVSLNDELDVLLALVESGCSLKLFGLRVIQVIKLLLFVIIGQFDLLVKLLYQFSYVRKIGRGLENIKELFF